MKAAQNEGSLAALALDEERTVRAVRVDERDARWLAAAGLFVGQGVRVLRRGAFGGPLHVRVASGGDFAIDRGLASRIEVARDDTKTRDGETRDGEHETAPAPSATTAS